ncbi:MAG: hypothetical protein WC516_01645 [Patescibacteria group bacterium]
MKKTILFVLIGASLALAGCVQQTPTRNQNLNQNVNQPTVNVNQNTNQPANLITDWQTYQNEKYGFEMRYPKDWKIGENPTNVSLQDTNHKIGNTNIGGVIFFRFDTPLDEALKEYGFKKEDGKYFTEVSSGSWVNAQEKNINGIQVIVGKSIMHVRDGNKTIEKEGKKFFFIGKNSYYAIFQTPFYEDNTNIFDQILSTFKFTK